MKHCIKIFLLCFFCSISAQKYNYDNINHWTQKINTNVDRINSKQLELQIYHQDLFRFFRTFDTLKLPVFKSCNSIPFSEDSLKLHLKGRKLKKLKKQIKSFYLNQSKFDSLVCSINTLQDRKYSSRNIDSLNIRLQLLKRLNISLQKNIKEIRTQFIHFPKIKERKQVSIMRKEIFKIKGIIELLKTDKKSWKEITYQLPSKLRLKFSNTFWESLMLFQERLDGAKTTKDSLHAYHLFVPKKYFDIWLWKKYKAKYWETKHLEDIIVHPDKEIGLISQLNFTISKEKGIQELKDIQDFESLEFEFKPITNSPFGNKKNIFVILILDVSNSMNINNKLGQLKTSVKKIVDALRENDKIAIILFSSVSRELVLPNDIDKEWIKYQIDHIKAFGETFPESAIFRAYNIMNLQIKKNEINKVILITDGSFDVTGKMKYHIKLGTKKKINFSIIKLLGLDNSDTKSLKNLVRVGKGNFHTIEDQNTYNTIINELLEEEY